MSELTLGQTVARDVLMVIAFSHSALDRGHSLLDKPETSDKREKVFRQIADAVDQHVQGLRDDLEDEMMQGISTGSLSGTVTLFVDFEAAIEQALVSAGFNEDMAKILVAHMPRNAPHEAEVVELPAPDRD